LPELGRLTPSARSILVGLALLALAVGAYVGARNTSVFAVRTLEIRGGTASVRAEVRAALTPDLGTSLLRIDGSNIDSRLAPIPDVHSFHYDRSFPHTLRIVVRRERPVLVVRRGAGAFLVAASGRVLAAAHSPAALAPAAPLADEKTSPGAPASRSPRALRLRRPPWRHSRAPRCRAA